MKVLRLAALVVAGAALLAYAGIGRPDAGHPAAGDSAQPNGITVNGSGKVTTAPDRADFWFGVQTRRKTADAALDANATAVAKVIAALENAGIADADIQTAQISIWQHWTGSGDYDGYDAGNSVVAKIRSLDKAGAAIDAAVAAGADNMSGPNLLRSDQEALYRQALLGAVANARAKAQAVASATGATLGRMTVLSETSYSQPVESQTTRPAGAPSGAAGSTGGAGTTVQPGTQEIVASVTVSFAVS